MLNYGINISDKKVRDDDECHLIQKIIHDKCYHEK